MKEPGLAKKAKALMPVEDALEWLLGSVTHLSKLEHVELLQGCDRVLAQDIKSAIDVPSFDNSAMDGYAVRCQDLKRGEEIVLSVIETFAAGHSGVSASRSGLGTAVRIFTGAPIPDGYNAVVMQEKASGDEENVQITGPVKERANIRGKGEDIAAGSVILNSGLRLSPQHLGLAASVGLIRLPVFRKLKVAIFCTGSELVEPGTSLKPGQIYNSNRILMAALLAKLGCDICDLGIIPDTLEATIDALRCGAGAGAADLIISSGGVSIGDGDHVKPAVAQLGTLDLWRLKMKPGKPLAFGDVLGTPFFGLPGNPVSAFVTFCIIARPFILKAQGINDPIPKPYYLRAGFARSKASDRQDYLRVSRQINTEGQDEIVPFHHQGSGVLKSLSGSDGLAVIPPDQTVTLGDKLTFYPFSELF